MSKCQSKCDKCNQYFNESEMRKVQYFADFKKKHWACKCEKCWQNYQFMNGQSLCGKCNLYFPKNKMRQIWIYAKQAWIYRCDACSKDLTQFHDQLKHQYLVISNTSESTQYCD